MHVVSSDGELALLVMRLVDVKVGGSAGKVEGVSEDVVDGVVLTEFADEAVDAEDGSSVELGSNRVDNNVPWSPRLVGAPDVLDVFVQWIELLSMELNEIVAVPVVFDVNVDCEIEDGPPDSHERVLDEVSEIFDEAETGSCDVGTDVVEAVDVAAETEVDDPGSEDMVPVFEAGSWDDGSVASLLMVVVAGKVDEPEAPEPVLVDTGEPTEVSVELLPVDVTEFRDSDDGRALPEALMEVVRVDPVLVLVQDSVLDRREGQATLHAQADMYARLLVLPHYKVPVSKQLVSGLTRKLCP